MQHAALDSLRPVAALLALTGAAHAADLSLASRRADFERLVAAVNEDYAYLADGGNCWADVRARYAARADAATTDDARRRVLEDALDELHDSHAEIAPGSSATRWAVPSAADVWAEWRVERAVVSALRVGSDAAARAGVRIGDEVVQVDGVPVTAAVKAELHCDAARASPVARRWASRTRSLHSMQRSRACAMPKA